MRRTLVIGDIHGGLRALHQVMERASVDARDTLIFLGDYVDGWSQSPEVLDYLIELQHRHHCIFIRGNHDELVLNWLEQRNENIDERQWYKNGGEATVLAYQKVSEAQKKDHITFLKALKNYHLDDHNRLFVHAGFTNMNGITYEYYPRMLYWDRTLWETALALPDALPTDSLFYPRRFTLYTEIYIGHTPVTKIGQTVPVHKAGVWNVDTGAAFTGPLTLLDVDSKVFWQSEPLPQLYPNEKGRN
ncbi:metallophosphoesterase family protein [Flavobacterium sp.]|uniref:metallophosphoesterase family protein n=1 Tax=Flavobacterium sp. TaxID=239 RepID=UPI003341DEB9